MCTPYILNDTSGLIIWYLFQCVFIFKQRAPRTGRHCPRMFVGTTLWRETKWLQVRNISSHWRKKNVNRETEIHLILKYSSHTEQVDSAHMSSWDQRGCIQGYWDSCPAALPRSAFSIFERSWKQGRSLNWKTSRVALIFKQKKTKKKAKNVKLGTLKL